MTFFLVAAAGGLLCGCGCAGRAAIQLVSLSVNMIDPPDTRVMRFDPQEAYWWIDDAGLLNIAMRYRRRHLLLGAFGDVEFDVSLVPGPPPAGSARNYAIHQRETRAVLNAGIQQHRFISYAGIVDVLMDDARHIHGSFRIWTKMRQPSLQISILPQRPDSVLFFGTFHAVKNKDAGHEIRTLTEAGGWQRPRRRLAPATHPTTSARPSGPRASPASQATSGR